MKNTILAAASGIAMTIATPALAADVQDGAVETVAVEMSDERYALALAAVDAYWPQGLSAYTTNYFLNDFADEILYTPIGQLVEKYGVIELAGEVSTMIKEIEALETEAAGETDGEGEEKPAIEISPEQALKGMVAMFEDQRVIDMVSAQDEHFEERLAIVRDVINEEMPGYAAKVEPKMRAEFAEMFARRFNDQELRDLAAFGATPTGQKYAREQWTMWVDPAYFRALFAGGPESLAMGKSVMEKLETRMAHLPPMFPEPEPEAEAEEAIEEVTEETTAASLIEEAEMLEAEAAELLEHAAALRAQAAEL